MNKFKKAYYLLRYLGLQIIWMRAGVYVRKRLRITERVYRPRPWEQISLSEITVAGTPTVPEEYAAFKCQQNRPFLFPLGQAPAIPEPIRVGMTRQPPFDERLDLLKEHRPVHFFRFVSPGPVDWHVNPFQGKRADSRRTWCELPDFAPEQGDLRALWEPSRAAWAIDIAKAKSRHEPVDAAALYWEWLDSWMQSSPPYLGSQWKCGQESSVRLIALALGFWTVARDPVTTPERFVQFARLAWATGYRVAHHIDYAISQKNNHSMSEAVGLMLVSLLFPEFNEARAWWETGRRVLEMDIRRQVAGDGTYVQSSFNYERVMLQVCTLGMRLAELAEEPLPRAAYERLDRACEFLFQMMEPSDGKLPNYGANDGALVLPLSECEFGDYRPALQAVYYLVHRRRWLERGPWDEDLVWLFGPEAIDSPQGPSPRPVSSRFDEGGHYTLRGSDSWVMTRCHTYRDRVQHIDPLHVDLWWRGQNVLVDCGSYQYYTPEDPRLESHFKSIAAHNTVEIDGRDPLTSVSRFLWLPWIRSSTRQYHADENGPLVFEGEHYAYDRAPWHVVHRRTILGLAGDVWLIVDDLLGEGQHRAVLRWHTLDVPFEWAADRSSVLFRTPRGDLTLCLATSPGVTSSIGMVRGLEDQNRIQGFASPYYSERLPIPVIELEAHGALPMRLMTLVAPGADAAIYFPQAGEENCRIAAGSRKWIISLTSPSRQCLQTFRSVTAS